MTITHINPATLHRNPVFSQGTLAIYVDRETTLEALALV